MNAIKSLLAIAAILGFLSTASAESYNGADPNLVASNHNAGDGSSVDFVKKDPSGAANSQCPCNQTSVPITGRQQVAADTSDTATGAATKGLDGNGP